MSWTVGAEADDWRVASCFVALGCGVAAVNETVPAPGCTRIPLTDGPVQTYTLFWRLDPELDALADGIAVRAHHTGS